jgi:hypothetical protein
MKINSSTGNVSQFQPVCDNQFVGKIELVDSTAVPSLPSFPSLSQKSLSGCWKCSAVHFLPSILLLWALSRPKATSSSPDISLGFYLLIEMSLSTQLGFLSLGLLIGSRRQLILWRETIYLKASHAASVHPIYSLQAVTCPW